MPVLSTKITERQLKILLWGDAGTRKTETVLRYFPNVLLFDIEGNGDQAVGMDEVPPFYIEKTKDVYKVLDVMDKMKTFKFPDGGPVRTVSLDSVSILWSVRSDVGARKAELRAKRWNKSSDDANMTPLDWGVAKRPLRRLHDRLSGLPVDFIFLLARERDIFKAKEDGSLEQLGVGIDSMKGLRYEANISFQMVDEGGWKCRVDKVQGALGKLLPKNSEHKTFPYQVLLDYVRVPVTEREYEDEGKIASEQLAREETEGLPRTREGLIKYAGALGLSQQDIAKALTDANIKFDPDHWDELVEVVKNYK